MYICERCGYSTVYKSNLRNHYNRNNVCKPKLKNISPKWLIVEYARALLRSIENKHIRAAPIAVVNPITATNNIMKSDDTNNG